MNKRLEEKHINGITYYRRREACRKENCTKCKIRGYCGSEKGYWRAYWKDPHTKKNRSKWIGSEFREIQPQIAMFKPNS